DATSQSPPREGNGEELREKPRPHASHASQTGGDPASSARGVDAAYRRAQLARGERPAYPEVKLRPGVVLPAGRLSWERFMERATPAQVDALAQRLDEMEAARGGEEGEVRL